MKYITEISMERANKIEKPLEKDFDCLLMVMLVPEEKVISVCKEGPRLKMGTFHLNFRKLVNDVSQDELIWKVTQDGDIAASGKISETGQKLPFGWQPKVRIRWCEALRESDLYYQNS